MTARGRLQRAAVRFTERRQAGWPGDVVELESAARELAAIEPLTDDERAFLATFRRLSPEFRAIALGILEPLGRVGKQARGDRRARGEAAEDGPAPAPPAVEVLGEPAPRDGRRT